MKGANLEDCRHGEANEVKRHVETPMLVAQRRQIFLSWVNALHSIYYRAGPQQPGKLMIYPVEANYASSSATLRLCDECEESSCGDKDGGYAWAPQNGLSLPKANPSKFS